jgi:putative colanic acid biosynthesis acetyltransferase WcaF
MGAKIGKSVRIFPSVRITYPWNLEIKDYSIISWNVQIYNLGKIFIGSESIISQNAHICAGNHDYQSPRFTLLMPEIQIGNQVWIAADAFVGPGCKIGDRVVVGARSVVVKSIEDGKVVGGNPAKVLKNRDQAIEFTV